MEVVKPTPEQKAVYDEIRKRAKDISDKCVFAEGIVSSKAREACKVIEMIFEEATQEIAMMLPGDFRTALCMEHLENACLWAKKAIHVHDKYITKLQTEKEENGRDNTNAS